jgi:hypothetical protein
MKLTRMFTIIIVCVGLMLLTVTTDPVDASAALAPNAPSNLTSTYYPPLTARLRWKDNSTNETKFKLNVALEMPSDNSQCPTCPRTWVKTEVGFWFAANTTAVDFKMQYGGKYTFTVQARGKSDTDLSAKSNAVTVHAPPVPPTNLTVTKTGSGTTTKYNATWKDNSNNEGINILAIGYSGGLLVYGYQANTISAAIPASAIPASAKQIEFVAGAIPASAIPASYKKSGDAIPASSLNVLKITSDSSVKYFSGNSYLPLIISSNLVKISK